MGLPVELEDESDKNRPGKAAGRMITAGRASKFVQGMDASEMSIQEDPNDEFSDTESEEDSSQFDMVDDSDEDD